MGRTTIIDGIELTLAAPVEHAAEWIDYNGYAGELEAAWLRLRDDEPTLNPRLIGDPGLGKTTLASFVARRLGREVYIFQCTMDTRPDDLLVAPVLAADRRVEYRASSVVSAMVRGGVVILDEGNRMPERSWAALAPLMDDRRYVESTTAGIRVHAHRDFRLCVTMNNDSSVYELPGYIQSRLKPRIDVVKPSMAVQERVLREKCPGVDAKLLRGVIAVLTKRQDDCSDSIRDMITLAYYAQRLKASKVAKPLERAVEQVLQPKPPGDDDDGDEEEGEGEGEDES